MGIGSWQVMIGLYFLGAIDGIGGYFIDQDNGRFKVSKLINLRINPIERRSTT